VNGVNVGSNNPTYTTSTLTNNSQVKLILTSNSGCANPATVNSNVITMTVTPTVTPGVVVTGVTTVQFGSTTVMSAIVVNAGSLPSYQWQDSTPTHNWQNLATGSSANIYYSPAASGDKLRCNMTSSAVCASPSTVTSAPVTFTVIFPTGIGPVQQNGDRIKIYPNPAHTTVTIDSLKIFDKWETIELLSVDGRQTISQEKVQGRISVTMKIDQLSAGMYIVILRRQSKNPVYLKFVKY
jgi:hypothetical protein